MAGLREETHAFKARKKRETEEARQAAAFFLACGIDLGAALAADGEDGERLRRRLSRLIERERLRGMRRHWSYDLNRHIALKQALDRLERCRAGQPGTAPGCRTARRVG